MVVSEEKFLNKLRKQSAFSRATTLQLVRNKLIILLIYFCLCTLVASENNLVNDNQYELFKYC